MKRNRLAVIAVICVFILVFTAGCSNKPKTDKKKAEAIKAYNETIGADAKDYFSDLSESTCGVVPERIYLSVAEFTPDEILKADPVSWQDMIEKGVPLLVAELHKKPEIRTMEDCYSEEEIHDVLAEAVGRGLIVNICFDGDRETYEIDKDGKITVLVVEGADGGAYKSTYEYQL